MRIGQGHDASIGRIDYSGIERAAAAHARGIRSIGNSLADTITSLSNRRKENKKKEAEVKGLAEYIEAAAKILPNQSEALHGVLSEMESPGRSTEEKLAIGSHVESLIGKGLEQQQILATERLAERQLAQGDRRIGLDESRLDQQIIDLTSGREKLASEERGALATADAYADAVLEAAGGALTPKMRNSLDSVLSNPDTTAQQRKGAVDAIVGLLPKAEQDKILQVGDKVLKQTPDGRLVQPVIHEELPRELLPPIQPTNFDGSLLPPKDRGAPTSAPATLDGSQLPRIDENENLVFEQQPRFVQRSQNKKPQIDPLKNEEQKLRNALLGEQLADRQAERRASLAAEEKKNAEALQRLRVKRNAIEMLLDNEHKGGFMSISGYATEPGILDFDREKADATALLRTIKAQDFLSAVEAMKGLGTLSDAEGQRINAALNILPDPENLKKTRLSHERMKQTLEEVLMITNRAIKQAQQGGLIDDTSPLGGREERTQRLRDLLGREKRRRERTQRN